jgi:type II secretory pathway pseudopilin PulG
MASKILNYPTAPSRSSGFTLVEVAIVVLIAGLLLVPFLKGLEIWNERQAIKTTRENIKEVHLALSRYVKGPINIANPAVLRERLPCPARADLPDTDPNFGASVDCNTVTSGSGIVVVPGERPGTEVVIGAVPFRDLSIPADLASDAWGGRLTYAVTRNLATTPPPTGGFNENAGAIRFINETGGDVIDPASGLYAVISHGESGGGSFSKAGGVLRGACPTGTLDSENCDNTNAVFRTMNITETSGVSYFDDFAAVQRNLVVQAIALPTCGSGQYLTTVGGTPTCVALPALNLAACPTGQMLKGVNNGSVQCEDIAFTPSQLNIQTVTERLCARGAHQSSIAQMFEIIAQCPNGQELLGCGGGPGDQLENGEVWILNPDFINRRCIGYSRQPACHCLAGMEHTNPNSVLAGGCAAAPNSQIIVIASCYQPE